MYTSDKVKIIADIIININIDMNVQTLGLENGWVKSEVKIYIIWNRWNRDGDI